MKLTNAEAKARIEKNMHLIIRNLDEVDDDGNGQLVLYTDVFRWSDGSYNDEAEE